MSLTIYLDEDHSVSKVAGNGLIPGQTVTITIVTALDRTSTVTVTRYGNDLHTKKKEGR